MSQLRPTQSDPLAVDVKEVGVGVGEDILLHPVSFTVEAGQGLALAGANGAGKTTLLRVLAGLVVPSSGKARVAGLAVSERSPRFRRMVAALIGYPPVARDLTVEEHLVLVAASWGATIPAARERAGKLLDDFGIVPLRRRFAHELSSGQTQLFSLALTLARPFDLLLLDEPEQRLDSDRLALVTRLLRQLVDDGKTLVFASHSRMLIEALSDRTISLDRPP